MPSLAELRAELKELRKTDPHHGPVSRMKKADVSAALDRFRTAREETPAAAAVPSTAPRRSHPAVESLQAAKESEFPVTPDAPSKKMAKAAAKAPARAAPKSEKMSKKDMMSLIHKLMSSE